MDLPQKQDLLFCEILTTNIFFPDFKYTKILWLLFALLSTPLDSKSMQQGELAGYLPFHGLVVQH
jgi:hypothetical protein